MTVIDFLRLTRRSWRALVIFAILGAIAMVGYTAAKPKVFEASSSGFIVAGSGGVISGSTDAVDRISAYLPLISTTPVLQKIQQNPQLDLGDTDLAGALSASIVPGSTMIQVSGTASTPKAALALANGGLKALTEVITDIETAGSADRVPSIKVVPLQNAALPSAPINRHFRTNLLLGLVGGLVLGYVFVFLRGSLETRVRSVEELTELLGTGLLGAVPRVANGALDIDSTDRDAVLAAEAIRQVRTALSFSSVDQKVRSIAVTSANAGEGKTSVATRLAQVFARSDREVVIIDADLRRPTVSQQLGLDDSVGLSELLSGQAEFADVILVAAGEGLYVLPAGHTPPNPSEMLGSAAFRTLVSALADDYFVIVDAPPVLPVTDASLISTVVDGVVFVAVAGKTKKPTIVAAHRMLSQVGAHLLGGVLNMVPLRGADSAAYGYYGKKYGYYAADSDPGRKQSARSAHGRRRRGRAA